MTPKQRVIAEHPEAFSQEMLNEASTEYVFAIVTSETDMTILGAGANRAAAWRDAAARMK